MNASGTLHIHYGNNNTIIISCNETVIVEVSEKIKYALNPHENTEHLAYIETLYECGLIADREHKADEKTVFRLHKGGTVYTLKDNPSGSKVASLGEIQQIEKDIKILVIDFKGSQSQYVYVENLQLLEVF